MSSERKGVSLSGLIAGTIGLLGAVGIATQIVAYAAAREFYTMLGLEPTDVGVTPFNAALRLTRTAADVFVHMLELLGLLFGLAVVLAGIAAQLRFARARKRTKMLQEVSVLQGRLALLEKNDPHQIRRQQERHDLQQAVAVKNGHVDSLGPWTISDYMKRLARLALAFLVFGAVYAAGLGGYGDALASAQQFAYELQRSSDRSTYTAPLSLQLDLAPKPVIVQWLDSSKVPVALRSLDALKNVTPGDVEKMSPEEFTQLLEKVRNDGENRTFEAYELGNVDGRSILWFRPQRTIITIDSSDIVVERVSF